MEPATQRDDQDRISQLPDPVLHHILTYCFLDTKHVVRTCVLSRRWRNVWASMPNLLFLGTKHYDGNEEVNIDFPTFVNTVLRLREHLDVHSFCIAWSNEFREPQSHQITSWVQYAVNHNVKELRISLSTDYLFHGYEFPSLVFTCHTLEYLYLSIYHPFADLSAAVCLGRLRELHLCHFASGTVLLNTLIYGCPVLEYLRLELCELQDADISSKSLKNLIIVFCVFYGTRIRISVPNLQFLDINGNDIQSQGVLLENLSSLVEATLQTEKCDGPNPEEFDQEPLKFVSPSTEGVSRQVLSDFQSFYKLTKLRLYGRSMLENFPAVAHFLQHSPNLKLLTLENLDWGLYKLDPTLKKWFVCLHRKIHIISHCGVENDRILELMTDFFSSK